MACEVPKHTKTQLKLTKLLPPTHTIAKGPADREVLRWSLKGGVKSHALSWSKLVVPTRLCAANWSVTDKDRKSIGGLATHIFERQNHGALKLKAPSSITGDGARLFRHDCFAPR
jgi:hypothetical protein